MPTTKSLIRNDTNYGIVGVYQIDEIQFVCSAHYAKAMQATEVPVDEIPEFDDIVTIRVPVRDTPNEWMLYPLRKRDIIPLAQAISRTRGMTALITAHARNLATIEGGLVMKMRSIVEFYDNLSDEEIMKASF